MQTGNRILTAKLVIRTNAPTLLAALRLLSDARTAAHLFLPSKFFIKADGIKASECHAFCVLFSDMRHVVQMVLPVS